MIYFYDLLLLFHIVCVCVHMCACVRACVCVCVCVYVHVHMHVCIPYCVCAHVWGSGRINKSHWKLYFIVMFLCFHSKGVLRWLYNKLRFMVLPPVGITGQTNAIASILIGHACNGQGTDCTCTPLSILCWGSKLYWLMEIVVLFL